MNAFRPTLCALALACIACGPPPEEAPLDLSEPAVHLFANFDDAEDDLVPFVEALDEYARGLDHTLPKEDRTFAPTNLTEADFGDLTHPDLDLYPLENIGPVAIVGQSRHGIDRHRSLALEPNHICIESGTTKIYRRVVQEGDPCFGDGTCDRANTTNEVWKKNFVADVWYDLRKDFRAITLSDGREALIARTWSEQAFDGESGGNGLEHGHGFELWAEHPDDPDLTTRVYATWFALRIVGLGEDVLANLTRDGLDEGMIYADEFLDGEITTCSNDRDATDERPQ